MATKLALHKGHVETFLLDAYDNGIVKGKISIETKTKIQESEVSLACVEEIIITSHHDGMQKLKKRKKFPSNKIERRIGRFTI